VEDPNFVLTLDIAYASDPLLTDLIDGEYRVLGKVTRLVSSEDSEGFNLLRKTSLGHFDSNMMNQLEAPFRELQQTAGLQLPEFKVSLEPPVVQLLPVAIFA
jgi:hypothetical protein